MVAGRAAERTRSEAIELLLKAGLAASPVNTYNEAAKDPHLMFAWVSGDPYRESLKVKTEWRRGREVKGVDQSAIDWEKYTRDHLLAIARRIANGDLRTRS